MDDLSLQEIRRVRAMATPAYLRAGCARAFSVATTYLPALCEMAEKFYKIKAGQRVNCSYSAGLSSDGTWLIRCSDGYEEPIGRGEKAKASCQRLVERLNGNI